MAKKKLEPVIGLDVGSYSIKSVEVSPDSGAKLRQFSVLNLDSPTPESLQEALKSIVGPYQGRSVRWRISVAGPSLLMRRIQLPVMTPAELKGAILFEAESQIPFPINDCQLDFQILNTQALPAGRQADNKTMNVLLVAAKKDFIQERLKVLSALGVTPETIDADIFCLTNAFEWLGEEAAQKTYGVLNIGHTGSSFAILQDKIPFSMRDIPVGGAEITKQLALAKGISEPDAEKMKISHAAPMHEELKAATAKGLESLAEEIKHSVDYFENETSEDLKTIWLSGGGALAEDAASVLSEELGRPVQFWDNLKKMEVSGDADKKNLGEQSRVLNVALGMALKRAGHKA